MAREPRARVPVLVWAFFTALSLGVAALFYGRGLASCHGAWPAPLDDVYIHYDFARAWAEGHPGEWIAGQGYSSGETSPLYAVALAVGYFAGFRGAAIGVWAAVIAVASLIFLMASLSRLVAPSPRWLAPLGAVLVVVDGTVGFAWWSGMEVALTGAFLGALLVATRRAREATPLVRARRQWWVGLLGAALVLLRPEAAVLVAVTTFVVARRPGARSPLAAGLRVALPGALTTLAVAGINLHFTGDAASAGALLKLLSRNPFATDADRAKDYLVNLFSLFERLRTDLGDAQGSYVYLLPLLALASLTSRRTRALGAQCLAGAVAFSLLVSWNGAARFQNLRYYTPAILLVLIAATLGLAALSTLSLGRFLGGCVALVGILFAGSHLPEAARFYARAARNIHDQQVTVGERLRQIGSHDAIVLVGDAGAIPYVSSLHAVDALGLGGYHGVPFVRAAVLGEAATLELIERLPASERPTLLALYPNWFPGITGRFGHERDRVTIDDNVICGGVTKVVDDADWSALGEPGDEGVLDVPIAGAVRDEVDVADVVSEAAHAYVSPAPSGGWTLFAIREARGVARFDAGRIVPALAEESFAFTVPAPAGSEVVVRTDRDEGEVVLGLPGLGRIPLVLVDEPHPARWRYRVAKLPADVAMGTRVTLRAEVAELHDFHVWLVGGKP